MMSPEAVVTSRGHVESTSMGPKQVFKILSQDGPAKNSAWLVKLEASSTMVSSDFPVEPEAEDASSSSFLEPSLGSPMLSTILLAMSDSTTPIGGPELLGKELPAADLSEDLKKLICNNDHKMKKLKINKFISRCNRHKTRKSKWRRIKHFEL